MSVTTKILKQAAIGIESPSGTYTAPGTLLPFTEMSAMQEWGMVEDEGIVGVAFKGLPAQGVKKVTGSISLDLDVLTGETILEAAMGAVTSHVFTCPSDKNIKSISACILDGVKTNKYAGCFLNNLLISSQASDTGSAVKISADMIGYKAEVRDDTAFPTTSIAQGTRLLHQHMSNTNGYFRIGDQSDALSASDNNTLIESVEIGGNWGFDFQFANDTISLIPLSGTSGRPSASLKFKIARHDSDAYKAWRDAGTHLQAAICWYASATAVMLIEIPNFILNPVKDSDGEIIGQEIECLVARNGISTSYDNANMTFNSPFRITITNA